MVWYSLNIDASGSLLISSFTQAEYDNLSIFNTKDFITGLSCSSINWYGSLFYTLCVSVKKRSNAPGRVFSFMQSIKANLCCSLYAKGLQRSMNGLHSEAEAKTYRSINLISFPFRALEKTISKHLNDSVLSQLSLHENQYAYLAGKFYQQSIHSTSKNCYRQ